ncbi:pimeloyl-ACP methyl ester esterase BioH [Shewanella sp. NIFS-20-20]|uniref:pimeloyl-ACP methyl ester esterase BioH n=1 Tax=Shewanella sp. NIFS-20-20 TaxID=2853806 RepID=UPI001C45B702|nr:pimeloyl-ACP methyl ester esterase BioH [Shewanella sp. NIFS-20-20]MBV7317292.1 pimeloyl-ACP methyl ester esterase BioH [Shewanella sp. NIFS-20-20]
MQLATAPLAIESFGHGQDLVLLHGWGVNSGVFMPLVEQLSQYKVHLIDLPGFGHSPLTHNELQGWLTQLQAHMPKHAIILGWSLGGLLASLLVHQHPQHYRGLITVASSPCFQAKSQPEWPGIAPQVLSQFHRQLDHNLEHTIERFLAIQAMGSVSAKADIKQIRQHVLARPLPQKPALEIGLDWLATLDIRQQCSQISRPWLRMWGMLDGLVPKKVIPLMPQQPLFSDYQFAKASHGPFISHPEEFVSALTDWITQLPAKNDA